MVRLAAHVSIYEAVAGEDWAGLGEEGEIRKHMPFFGKLINLLFCKMFYKRFARYG